MMKTIILFVLQLLRTLPGGSNAVYTDVKLTEGIAAYAEAEGIAACLNQNSDAPAGVVRRYLELRFSNLKAMTCQSARYFFLHWETLRMLWGEAKLLHQKASALSESELTQEKRRIQNLSAELGCDQIGLQFANEIIEFTSHITNTE